MLDYRDLESIEPDATQNETKAKLMLLGAFDPKGQKNVVDPYYVSWMPMIIWLSSRFLSGRHFRSTNWAHSRPRSTISSDLVKPSWTTSTRISRIYDLSTVLGIDMNGSRTPHFLYAYAKDHAIKSTALNDKSRYQKTE